MAANELEDLYFQKDNISYLKEKYGRGTWVTLNGNQTMNGAKASFWCGLIDCAQKDYIFEDCSWDITRDSGMPGFEGVRGKYIYRRILLDNGLEPLLYYRDFWGVRSETVDLSQEFILLNNLYYDESRKEYWAQLENGESECVVKYKDATNVEGRLDYLINYASAKQMILLLYFDIRAELKGTLQENGLNQFANEYKDDELFYHIYGDEISINDYTFSRLVGKKLLYPKPIEKCGYWPYEPLKTYETYVIGIDKYGDNIESTCDPKALADYFGGNPGAPMYLTPVLFRREVLQKYYQKPELYDISDGRLQCKGLWSIEIDNHHKDFVSVYLGDLGTYLPESEQKYWKSYNIIGEKGISRVAYLRDFLCVPAESQMADHRFKRDYIKLQEKWIEKYGWPLFRELAEKDKYNFSMIRIPISNSQLEFDGLVLSLVKVLVDSLNEKELVKGSTVKDQKGISKLETWLINNGAVDYQEHISYLRDLQELRSTGSGHRKGDKYKNIIKKLSINEGNLPGAYSGLLQKASAFLEYLEKSFLSV